MASSTKNDENPAFGDPYKILNVEFGATDEEISKAYRRLALKYHPDKQKKSSALTPEEIQDKFHSITEAKSFLLDSEHQAARIKYDAKRKSEISRKKENALREQRMSIKRKRMRDELYAKENGLRAQQTQSTSSVIPENEKRKRKKDYIDKLKRTNIQMRETLHESQLKKEAQNTKKLQSRQIRLKWSRSRISGPSPSEESIAKRMSEFGNVEYVEFIGAKGNAALITFQNELSCDKCVKAFLKSEEMRAFYVDKLKHSKFQQQKEEQDILEHRKRHSNQYDFENLKDRESRQAKEREELLRQLEEEDNSTDQTKGKNDVKQTSNVSPTKPVEFYPPQFPPTIDDDKDDDQEKTNRKRFLTPMDRLEQLERIVLPLCVSSQI